MPHSGSKRDFVRLLTKHERMIYGYVLSLVPNLADADEIVQETSLRLWDEFDKFIPGSSFAAWSLTVAHYEVLTWRKRAALSIAGGAAALLLGSDARADHNKVRTPARGAQRDEFTAIQQHENDHVAFLVNALGPAARPKPTFQGLEQDKFQDFVVVAQALENTGVGAYLGAAPVLDSMGLLAAAGSITTVEARHAGYLNAYLGDPITTQAGTDDEMGPSFDMPLTAAQVVAAAGGFIADLNGGPPVDYSNTPSEANDVAILNYALALEYLEAEFYNVNVPKFYKARR